MLKAKLDNYFPIEKLPPEILVGIIFLLNKNDKLSLRLTSKSFSRIVNRDGAWSGKITDFYTEGSIIPKLIEENFYKKINQQNISLEDFTTLLKNLNTAKW
ncbi:MAG: F-box protein [Gammaproteobacteria bacterium]|nr:F-box protein [Gammaproteobacteria bacterium]